MSEAMLLLHVMSAEAGLTQMIPHSRLAARMQWTEQEGLARHLPMSLHD